MKRMLLVAAFVLGSCGKTTPPGPPIPFDEEGACPFQCCTYREWSVDWATDLHADRRDDSSVVFHAALDDTVSSFIHDPATRLIQVPVSTGGRVGSVTIFADSVRHRWLVRCDGLAPNARDQAYQLWFVTDQGTRPAAVMAMDRDQPMVMALPLPQAGEQVRGAAMTVEPRAGSPSPSGPTVFRLEL